MNRVAICYSGQPRDIEHTFKNHQENLISQLINEGYEVDIFAHLWFDSKNIGMPYWVDYPERGSWSESTKLFVQKNMAPVNLVFSEPKDFKNHTSSKPDERFPHPINNTLSMFYGIEQVFNLKQQYQVAKQIHYDLAIRIRPDLFFRKKFDKESLGKLHQSSINVLDDENKHMSFAIGDHFAIGPDHLMDQYSRVFSNFEKIVASQIPVNPECLLGGWLMIKKIDVQFHDWNHCLYRDSMAVGFKDKLVNLLKRYIR